MDNSGQRNPGHQIDAYRPTYRQTTTTQSPQEDDLPIGTSVRENLNPTNAYFGDYAQIGTPIYLPRNLFHAENMLRSVYYKAGTTNGHDSTTLAPEIKLLELKDSDSWSTEVKKADEDTFSKDARISHYIPHLSTNSDTTDMVIGRLISLKEDIYGDEQDVATDFDSSSASSSYPQLSQIFEKDDSKFTYSCLLIIIINICNIMIAIFLI